MNSTFKYSHSNLNSCYKGTGGNLIYASSYMSLFDASRSEVRVVVNRTFFTNDGIRTKEL